MEVARWWENYVEVKYWSAEAKSIVSVFLQGVSGRYPTMQYIAVAPVATPPTFLVWNNLLDLVYESPTRTYWSRFQYL